jgi:outer membrane protein OmpA-like peptidoglycan-associated protein/opacity protein-like surface antigen
MVVSLAQVNTIQGAIMRLAARCIVTLAIAFAMVPALCADGTAAPKVNSTAEGSSIASTSTSAKASPKAAALQPARVTASQPSKPEASPQSVGVRRKGTQSDSYTPKIEWFLGYSFWRAVPTSTGNRMGYLHGGSTSLAYNFNKHLGLVADFGGYSNSRLTLFSSNRSRTVDANGTAYTYLVGPRLSFRHDRFTPFIQTLFGAAHATDVSIAGCSGSINCTPLPSENAFAMTAGGGLDLTVSHRIALQLFQAEYLMTRFTDRSSAAGQTGTQNNVRLSTGILLRFGGNASPQTSLQSFPPIASCSVDKNSVYLGSKDTVTVRVEASDPGSNSLTYSWRVTDGTVEGAGPVVQWNSSGTSLGPHTVTAEVANARGRTADCSAEIRVEPQPNRPPTISCSADRRSVTAGETVGITAVASDPDNDPLSFSWNASAGKLEGSGSSVKVETAGVSPGSYTTIGHVNDGRSGTADCTVSMDVQAPAEEKALETRLSLHSIYFATARPTEGNPTGGLVESQQKVLRALAQDFNRYLMFEPQARLTLEGHADQRGSIEYNQRITERRVERAKNFLVEHGVPGGNIETRAVGKQDDLDADQVKQQMKDNPDLSADDHQKMLDNLEVIVLANNRRVDVSLSTTGQQSVRRYPFNAQDALALISPKDSKRQPKVVRKD